MRFRISLLAAVVLMFASFSQAENCTAGILDKAGVIRNTATIAAAARPLVSQGVDVRIVTVDHGTFVSNGSTLAGVETALEASCPNWIDARTGTRKANMFVVMVAPTDRQKNIFLGSYYAGSFDIPSTYSSLANASFKAGQWEQGIANTLNGTGTRAIAYHAQVFAAQQRARTTPPVRAYTATSPTPAYTTPQPMTQTADSGMSGLAIFLIVVLVLGVIGTILYFVFRTTEETTYTSSDSTYVPRSSSTGYPSSSSAPRRYAATAPSQTTVIVHDRTPQYDSSGNLITGMLIGEALSRNNQPTIINNPAPVYSSPAPSYEVAPAAPVVDAPDSTWGDPAPAQTVDAPDTGFGNDTPSFTASDPTPSFDPPADTPSFDPPSSDFGSSNDSNF
jgi:hypothetical protein